MSLARILRTAGNGAARASTSSVVRLPHYGGRQSMGESSDALKIPKRQKVTAARRPRRAGTIIELPPLPIAGGVKIKADTSEPEFPIQADPTTETETSGRTSALMEEVKKIQERYPEHVLLVQVGSFFEIYDHSDYLDEVAGLLHLKIARPKNAKDSTRRFAGLPAVKLRDYLEVLIKHGRTVALVEQVGKDMVNKSKNFLRDVTRIITPGTILDEDWVENWENNFLLCVAPLSAVTEGNVSKNQMELGLAWLDVSTGDFLVCDSSPDSFAQHLARIQPKEVLCDEKLKDSHPTLVESLRNRSDEFHLSFRQTEEQAGQFLSGLIIRNNTSKVLLTDSQTLLKPFSSLQMQAAGTLLAYVAENFRNLRPTFTTPAEFIPAQVMSIDPVTQNALEITRTYRERLRKGSLLNEIDKTKTAAGSRLLASRLKAPSVSLDEINRRLNLVDIFYSDTHLLSDVRNLLADCKDVERALQRIHLGKGGPGDYMNIMTTLRVASQIVSLLRNKANSFQKLNISPMQCDSMNELLEKLAASAELLEACDEIFDEKIQDLQKITDLDAIKEGISAVLDEKREYYRSLLDRQEALRNHYKVKYALGDKECNLTVEPKLGPLVAIPRLDAVSRQKVRLQIRDDYGAELVERSSTSPTIRFSHVDWTALSRDIEECTKTLLDIQADLFEQACGRIKEHTLAFVQTCKALAEVDVASASAAHAHECGYTRPVVTEERVHDVQGGRHPVVERAQIYRESMYMKNDFFIGDDQRLWLLTGPNMGGKSTFLRQSALMSVLAQTGTYVPASYARLGIVDKLFARVGASDDLAAHRSTFMVEMQETASILKNATERSFIIMDEIGRGTSTRDGFALAYATLVYLHNQCQCRAVFATHYHELATRVKSQIDKRRSALDSVECYQTAVLNDEDGNIIYTYQLRPGIMTRSHGIDCARAAGLPEEVVNMASNYYAELEREHEQKEQLWRNHMRSERRLKKKAVAVG